MLTIVVHPPPACGWSAFSDGHQSDRTLFFTGAILEGEIGVDKYVRFKRSDGTSLKMHITTLREYHLTCWITVHEWINDPELSDTPEWVWGPADSRPDTYRNLVDTIRARVLAEMPVSKKVSLP